MRDWFLEILLFSAWASGAFSASTKFCANALTSTPEPALREEMSFCAAAFDVALLAVVEVEDAAACAAAVLVDVVLLTEVVAMSLLSTQLSIT